MKQPGLDWFDAAEPSPASDRPATDLLGLDDPEGRPVGGRDRRRAGRGPRRAASVLLVLCAVVALALGGLIGHEAGLLLIAGLVLVAVGASSALRGSSRLLRTTRRTRGVLVLSAGVVVFLVGAAAFARAHDGMPRNGAVEAAAQETSDPTRAAASPSVDEAQTAGTALAALASLRVKGPSPMTGYDREGMFGEPWFDVDGNGCDTRDDVLRRDLDAVEMDGCLVRSGVLEDPYTRRTIVFARGWATSGEVQIDHVVALADAWRTGAQQLSARQRLELANDPINLYATDGDTNQEKSDGDAATWLPPNKSFRCTYVAHQIGVKERYGLWVTPSERDAMAGVLQRCPDTQVPEDAEG